jgi:uncharacterized protein YjbI with pentapeptide repeats
MNRQEADNATEEIWRGTRPPIRILRWWMVLLGGIVIVAVTGAVIAWLWTEAGSDPKLRIEAIKTGFTVGFGAGGSLALLLTARRQWLQERTQAHHEDIAAINQAYQERVAAANEYDAIEKRITELYVKAVEQLGSTKAPVRLGGMYALERLAQANHSHRQTVFDVICAYLRMPYTPPDEIIEHPPPLTATPNDSRISHRRVSAEDEAEQLRRREELQVRLTAQRILASHVRDERGPAQRAAAPPPTTFWPEIDIIDLTGAHLVDLNLQHCHVEVVQLNHAVLTGESIFRGMTCSLALIQATTFTGHTDFRGVTFIHDAWFTGSTFGGGVWFHADEFYPGARFGGHASFKDVTFAKKARFNKATFCRSVDFGRNSNEGRTKAVHLDGAHVDSPGLELIWPSGWAVELNPDGTGTVTQCTTTLENVPDS